MGTAMRDASNTGYITLTKHQGNLTITSPGVYDGLDISGYNSRQSA